MNARPAVALRSGSVVQQGTSCWRSAQECPGEVKGGGCAEGVRRRPPEEVGKLSVSPTALGGKGGPRFIRAEVVKQCIAHCKSLRLERAKPPQHGFKVMYNGKDPPPLFKARRETVMAGTWD